MKNNSTPTPLDAVLKTYLSRPHTARDFMALHLLPAIPVLFYQGRRSLWPYSMNWFELFSEP